MKIATVNLMGENFLAPFLFISTLPYWNMRGALAKDPSNKQPLQLVGQLSIVTFTLNSLLRRYFPK
jgi:hypothetical protein